MITVHIRKQGGAAIITIPSDVLRILDIAVGATLELEIDNQGFHVRPLYRKTHKRLTVTELLEGATPKNMKALKKATEGARKGKSAGRELP